MFDPKVLLDAIVAGGAKSATAQPATPDAGGGLADILRKLGKDGYVVNISRGSAIDQEALVTALADKTIAGAGLDVFDREPQPPGALTAFPNVVVTPHVGGHTLDAHVAMQNCVIANLEAFFAGKPLPYQVRDA